MDVHSSDFHLAVHLAARVAGRIATLGLGLGLVVGILRRRTLVHPSELPAYVRLCGG